MSAKQTAAVNKKLVLLIGIALAIAIIYFAIPKKESSKESEKSSVIQSTAPKDFHGILPEGTGGDPDLNKMKNRWSAPSSVTEMSISQIIALPHDALDVMNKD